MLCGLATAVANIDEVIRLIRTAPTPAAAHESLMARDWPAEDIAPLIALVDDPRHPINADGTYRLSDAQAKAILELRLARLTALGRDEIGDELQKLATEIADYLDILRSRIRIQAIIKDELAAVKTAFATPRRTVIQDWGSDLDDEDLIAREDMVVTRLPCRLHQARAALDLPGAEARRQGPLRHGDARRGFRHPPVRRQHAYPVLFFSSEGQVYKEKVWRLPLAAPNSRGKFLNNMLPLEKNERITTIMPLPGGRGQLGDAGRHVRDRVGQCPPQQALRLRQRQPRRQDRDEARRGRSHRRRADLHRGRRRAADHRQRPVHPLRGAGGARLQGPRFHRRARHQSRQG